MDKEIIRKKLLWVPRNIIVQYHPEFQALVIFGKLIESYAFWKHESIMAIEISVIVIFAENLRRMEQCLGQIPRGFTLEVCRQIKIIEFLQQTLSRNNDIRIEHLMQSPSLSSLIAHHHVALSDIPLAEMQSVLRQESRLNKQIARMLGNNREWDEGKQIGAVFSQLLAHKFYESSAQWLKMHRPRTDITSIKTIIHETLRKNRNNHEEYQKILECIAHVPVDEVVEIIYSLSLDTLRSDILTNHVPKILTNAPWTLQSQALILSHVIFKEIEKGSKIHYDHQLDHLLIKPLDLIEVLLMNQEWDVLSRTIPALTVYLSRDICPFCHQHDNFTQNRSSFSDLHSSSPLTAECLDNLLIVYALQSLDIQIVVSDMSQSMTSLEEITLDFDMPPTAPSKDDWIPDEAVTACMACKSTTFSMLRRRHHCRRCGRVVCKSCSTNKRRIPDMYKNLRVRVCDDCVRWEGKFPLSSSPPKIRIRPDDDIWILSGDHNEDQMLRDQFTYEESPSPQLCLCILNYHSSDLNVAKFLLWECDRLESLLRPHRPGLCNPEIDYCATAQMMKILAIAAKIRVDHPACDDFKLKADIILMVLEAKCESLLPVERLTTRDSLRKLKDNLLSAGVWQLALDISVKCGFACAGVMQAWGLDCLKQGQYAMAREKMSLCLQSLVPLDGFLSTITPMLSKRTKLDAWECLSVIDRPRKSSTVLADIVTILMSNDNGEFAFDESIYYLITYGSHEEIISFLMNHDKLHTSLLYILSQKIPYSTFMSTVFLSQLQLGQEIAVLSSMKKIDPTLWRWESFVKRFCWYLETQKKYESLYNIQILMNDPIRASMTCIQFYIGNAKNYTELQENLRFLITAKMHCLSELHNIECGEPIKEVVRITMDHDSLRKHIETIETQIDITEFLSSAEENGEDVMDNVARLNCSTSVPPTLFGGTKEAQIVPVLTLVSGNSLRRNFTLVRNILKIIPFSLDRIYESCAIFLSAENRFRDIKEMIICAKESNHDVNFDRFIYLAIRNSNIGDDEPKNDDIINVLSLIELIGDVAMKIRSYTHLGQLKTAYLLAVQHKRSADLRKIARKADTTKQFHIRRLCEKYFADNSNKIIS